MLQEKPHTNPQPLILKEAVSATLLPSQKLLIVYKTTGHQMDTTMQTRQKKMIQSITVHIELRIFESLYL